MNDKVREFRTLSFKESDYAPAAFFSAFLVGVALITISKSWQWPVWIVVLVPIIVITGYGVASYFLPRLAIREDQLGDNIYYLGFLLTLWSLTITLIQYRSDSDNDYIISNFGVALAATIWGILCRSILAQMRKDVVGIERELQKSLSEASFKLRGQIGAVSEDFASLTRQITQVTEDYSRDLVKSHQSLSSGLVNVIDEQTQSLQSTSESSAEKLGSSVEESVQAVEEVVQTTTGSLKETALAVRDSIDDVGKTLGEYLQAHAASLKEAQENESKDRQAITTDLKTSLESLRDTVGKVNANAVTSEQLKRFTDAFEVVALEMTEALQKLAKQALDNDGQIAELTQTLTESISNQEQKIEDAVVKVEIAAEQAEKSSSLAADTAALSEEKMQRLRSQFDAISKAREEADELNNGNQSSTGDSAQNPQAFVPRNLDDKET